MADGAQNYGATCRAAGGGGPGDLGDVRRRRGRARLPRGLPSSHRRARLAVLDDPGARRAGVGDMEGRALEHGCGGNLADRHLRPGARRCCTGPSAIPVPITTATSARATICTRNSVLALDAGDRQAEVALPVHAPRSARLGRDADAGAGRRGRSAGEARKLLLQANRNGFFYVLDRRRAKSCWRNSSSRS